MLAPNSASKSFDVIVLQRQTSWPNDTVVPLPPVKQQSESAAAAKHNVEPNAVAERKPSEEPAARAAQTVEPNTDKAIILDESDLAGEPLPDAKDDTTACPSNTPTPAPVSHPVAKTEPIPAPPPIARTEAPAPLVIAPKPVIGPGVVEVDDNNFQAEIENFSGTVLVDFNAKWCGPCRRAGPIVDAMAEEFQGRVKVAKIDIDRAPGLAARFGVSSIPCLILFNAGKAENREIGVPSAEQLRGWMSGGR
jgi:thioredoxin